MRFVHSGKCGDIVFGVPAFRASGCSTFVLHDHRQGGFWRYTPEVVLPLLESQGIKCEILRGGGVLAAQPDWVNGNLFRGRFERVKVLDECRFRNHMERQCLALDVPLWPSDQPWLSVTPRRVSKLVIVRSPRYRPRVQRVDWQRLIEWAGGDCVFLGLETEWRAFCTWEGVMLPYLATADYLDAAAVIAGCDVFAGNQTGLHAVAAGLGVPIILERCEMIDCCRFGRVSEWVDTDSFLGRPIDDQGAVKVG